MSRGPWIGVTYIGLLVFVSVGLSILGLGHGETRRRLIWTAIVMSEKEDTGHCWVVRWRLTGESSSLQEFFQVLPWRWSADKVKEYLYSLYYNCPTRAVAERTDWMNSKVKTGLLVIEEKKRVIVGEHPFLVADFVTDLSTAYDSTRDVEVLSYTEPSGTRFDIEGGKVLRNSSSVKVTLELKRKIDV